MKAKRFLEGSGGRTVSHSLRWYPSESEAYGVQKIPKYGFCILRIPIIALFKLKTMQKIQSPKIWDRINCQPIAVLIQKLEKSDH